MRVVSLGEVSELIDYGVTASAREAAIGPKFLRITDIQDDKVNWSTVPYCLAEPKKMMSSRLKAGDIVFARTGATTGKSFLIRSCPENAVFASYLIRVRAGRLVDPLFLSHYFQSNEYWGQIALKAAGAAQPGVNSTKLAELEIPLPPLDEQQRIAAILDQVDNLRRLRQRSLDRLNTLSQAIFYEMFGEQFTILPTAPLSDLLEEFRYGTSNKSGENGYPTLRIPNVIGSGIDLSELKTVAVTAAELNRLRLKDGDILFVRTNGNPDYVGRSAVFDSGAISALGYSNQDFIYASYLIRARPRIALLNPIYLTSYLNTPVGLRALKERSKTSAGQFNINTEGLGSLEIPLAPLAAQNEFAAATEKLTFESIRLKLALEKTDKLFSSLRHRAFRGEL